MKVRAEKQAHPLEEAPAPAARQLRAEGALQGPGSRSPEHILGMQRAAGNRAVRQLLSGSAGAGAVAGSRGEARGLPAPLKAGVESLSGQSFDDVTVHYNSSEPRRMRALAYTHGTEVHVAPGQEEHLPHELWHVAQQKQGRVSPTGHRSGLPVNDDAALEREADAMGARARSLGASHDASPGLTAPRAAPGASSAGSPVVQRMSDTDFRKAIADAVGLRPGPKAYQRSNDFLNWLRATAKVDPVEHVDKSSDEEVKALIPRWLSYEKTFGPLLKTNKEADVPVAEGMYFVASKAELEAGDFTGLYTTGAGPCVIVGFQLDVTGDPSKSVFALSHFDSEVDVKMLDTMYAAVVAKAGGADALKDKGHKITISLAGGHGGVAEQPAGKKERGGYQLFTACAERADALQSKDPNVNVLKRRTEDSSVINARLDAGGLKRFAEEAAPEATRAGSEKALAALKYAHEKSQMLASVHGDGSLMVVYAEINRRKMERELARAAGEKVPAEEEDLELKKLKAELESRGKEKPKE